MTNQLTAAPAATTSDWQSRVRQLWVDRIHREFCIYTNIGLNVGGAVLKGHDPNGIHTNPAYAYSQLCWQVGTVMETLISISEEFEVPLADVLREVTNYALEQHGEYHPALRNTK